jgi:hypothetical protein
LGSVSNGRSAEEKVRVGVRSVSKGWSAVVVGRRGERGATAAAAKVVVEMRMWRHGSRANGT